MYITNSSSLAIDIFASLDLHRMIEVFFDDLPKKPYCAEEKNYIMVKPKRIATTFDYIQPNHPAVTRWLVFDLDYNDALHAYKNRNCPEPQVIVANPENGHAHLFYRLAEPVGKWGNSSIKAIMYLTAVYNALALKLGADKGYSGNICKNPASDRWHSYTTDAPEGGYTLGELAEWLELDTWHNTARSIKKQAANDTAFGRNVSLFHGIRKQCYKLAGELPQRQLLRAITSLADDFNSRFDEPLPSNEVANTARSIYRYCSSARFKAAKTASDAQFSALQAYRGAKGGKVSKRPPIANSEATTKPWESLGISRKTYYKRKKNNAL